MDESPELVHQEISPVMDAQVNLGVSGSGLGHLDNTAATLVGLDGNVMPNKMENVGSVPTDLLPSSLTHTVSSIGQSLLEYSDAGNVVAKVKQGIIMEQSNVCKVHWTDIEFIFSLFNSLHKILLS